MNESAPKQSTIPEAMVELMVIEQMMRQEGSVDVEPDMLNQLRSELQSGKINPAEAVTRARNFLASRQSYH